LRAVQDFQRQRSQILSLDNPDLECKSVLEVDLVATSHVQVSLGMVFQIVFRSEQS
jgi:hypothetical protein